MSNHLDFSLFETRASSCFRWTQPMKPRPRNYPSPTGRRGDSVLGSLLLPYQTFRTTDYALR